MELGSEFEFCIEFKENNDNIFHYLDEFYTLYTASGRSALRVILNKFDFKTVLLPEYICESVVECFHGMNIIFYTVNEDLSIDVNSLFNKLEMHNIDCVYIMHYFGKLQNDNILQKINKWKREKKFVVIEDTTHSIFTKPMTIGDYCICSLRKWFCIPDGGVLYSKKDVSHIKLCDSDYKLIGKKLYAMILKRLYLSNVLIDCNPEYRQLFCQFDEDLDTSIYNEKISSLSIGLLKTISISEEIKQRKENYVFVLKKLNSYIDPVIEMEDSCPLVLPIFEKERDNFREYLIEHRVFCAVHWPIKNENTYNAEDISKKIISLPIDSRYSRKELQYLVDTIKAYKEKK